MKNHRIKPYFKGWYFKQLIDNATIAFIPGFQESEQGKTAFIQVITQSTSHFFTFPYDSFSFNKEPFIIQIETNVFSEHGIQINLTDQYFSCKGKLIYGKYDKPEKNIMGPLKYLPFLECSHEIISMKHRIQGKLMIDSKEVDFTDGIGYIEGDSGSSFPKKYIWTQCNCFKKIDCSITAAAATIPILKIPIPGCFCIIHHQNNHYLFASYYGAKITSYKNNYLAIKQGRFFFDAVVQNRSSNNLIAPKLGNMNRQITESAKCNIRYRLFENKELVFDLKSPFASFELVNN